MEPMDFLEKTVEESDDLDLNKKKHRRREREMGSEKTEKNE